ncbi:hypothetical protein [Aquitalea sp. ASV11]|uniref:hypothetical protein n=1 Tax=Aquitalea sp. ASV11 TaxID=2795103 RepID=UPI0018EA8A28|nr:hypothetical protein [Aquitalea sp. ASV11]
MIHIEKIEAAFKNHKNAGYCRRAAWPLFEDRLSAIFSEQLKNKAQSLSFYLITSKKNDEKYFKHYLYRFNIMNSAQITSGQHSLGVWHNIERGEPLNSAEHATEEGATLIFSQSITGKIMVLITPYKSKLQKINEDDIILAINKNPRDLTNKKIKKFINIYLKYCLATSMISSDTKSLYLFRLKLKFLDFRNRKHQLKIGAQIILQLVTILIGIGGIVATILTASNSTH